ncbi:hypothetical protein E2C01_004609 [Portunus trituberculatus]|uniref:Uncharacterized protein n=1 Tax=Portunus trituberculatus TaxID=210409 RepID=A0A5B7CWW0_PORTR|nr:hypothetical protein [Portunus trituberculatus]
MGQAILFKVAVAVGCHQLTTKRLGLLPQHSDLTFLLQRFLPVFLLLLLPYCHLLAHLVSKCTPQYTIHNTLPFPHFLVVWCSAAGRNEVLASVCVCIKANICKYWYGTKLQQLIVAPSLSSTNMKQHNGDNTKHSIIPLNFQWLETNDKRKQRFLSHQDANCLDVYLQLLPQAFHFPGSSTLWRRTQNSSCCSKLCLYFLQLTFLY